MKLSDTVQIAIKTFDGPDYFSVPAKLFGPLAVHKAHEDNGCWVVSHVATGCRATTTFSKREAMALAKTIQSFPEWLDTRLSFEKTDDNALILAALGDKVRTAIRELGGTI